MADDDWDPTIGQYTASPTLAPDDPLRQWGANLTPEELSHLAAGNDPQVAIDRLISRGVPPPPSSIMAFSGTPTVGWGGREYGDVTPAKTDPPPVFGADGKMQGNLTSDQGTPSTPAPSEVPGPLVRPGSLVDRGIQWAKDKYNGMSVSPSPPSFDAEVPLPTSDPRKGRSAAPSFDPEVDTVPAISAESIPLPVARPGEAGPGASDLSASKKQKTSEALDGFAKSFAGVKAPTAPPLNAVGTPGAPQHAVVQAPNITQLLSMIGQQQRPSALQTLGRLLVAGKA